jgi:two-component system nitrate/nitrite response regulator NarL
MATTPGFQVSVLRLLMVDDHLMLTEALSAHLSGMDDVWVVGQCATWDPALPQVVERLRPDVITIDVEPLGSSMREVFEQLLDAWPSARIVVLTAGHNARLAADAARSGAAAWVPKEHSVEELTEVVRGVSRGSAWYPPEVLGLVLRELRSDVERAYDRTGPLDVLSDRERDVLMGMVAGQRSAEIAQDLRISTETVRTHTRSILAKLHVHSQVEAVSVASAAGLRPSDSQRGAARVARISAFGRVVPRQK